MRVLLIAGAIALAAYVGSSAPAHANHYHTACVNHGFVHGDNPSDGAFHSRIEAGCGNPGTKRCRFLYWSGWGPATNVGAGVNDTCNVFTPSTDGFPECGQSAEVSFDNVFSPHGHLGHSPPC